MKFYMYFIVTHPHPLVFVLVKCSQAFTGMLFFGGGVGGLGTPHLKCRGGVNGEKN